MATRQSTKVANAGSPTKSLRVGLVAATAVYSVAAATSLSAGDVIEMVKAPQGGTLVYMALTGGSGDALVTVGDGVSTARYLSSVTMSSAQPTVRVINTASAPYTYPTDDTIDITVGTVSVGTITGGFHMTCIFAMDVL